MKLLFFSFLAFSLTFLGINYSFISKRNIEMSKIKIKVGAEVLLEKNLDLIKGKSIGIITNHSAIFHDGKHLVDILNEIPEIKIVALFGPEHGVRGDEPDGAKVGDEVDQKTKIKIYSLYGERTKPTPEMLKGIDILIYDIQDVGARFYTFQSTLFLTLEAAGENNIKYIVLDRPNPINGVNVEGPMIQDSLKSFVGLHNIPVRHGMTVGELAILANEEGFLKNKVKADLKVIKMEGWSRNLWYDETDLPWVKPSPNIYTIKTTVVYPGTCFFEGTTISEGRGSDSPFETIGAPYINAEEFAKIMNTYKLEGVKFEPKIFTPKNVAKVTKDPKFEGKECQGVFLDITDRNIFEPVKTGIYLLYTLHNLYPNDFKWRSPSRNTGHYWIDRLSGTDRIRVLINEGKKPEEILQIPDFDISKFNLMRKKHLLY
jgi:uncharacterized protein YbbC (DUF1343 family)